MIILILYNIGKDKSLLKAPKKGFEDLYEYFEVKGIDLCRAPIEFFDDTKKIFSKAQFFQKGNWIWKENVRPDIIFDKSPFFIGQELMKSREKISNNFPFVNDLEISKSMSDKWENYVQFSEYYPKTILIQNSKDLDNISKLNSKRVILKPLTGSGGSGIVISEKDKIIPIEFPFIVQELVFVNNPHDLRIVIVNNKPFYAFVRTPKKGELLANIARGGKIRVVPIDEISKNVLEKVKKIGKQLKKYENKLYSVDFIVDDNKKSWVLEMNSRPGIILEKEELKYREYFYDKLVNFFLNIKISK